MTQHLPTETLSHVQKFAALVNMELEGVQGILAEVKLFLMEMTWVLGEVRALMQVCVTRPERLQRVPYKIIHNRCRFTEAAQACLRERYELCTMDGMIKVMEGAMAEARDLRRTLKAERRAELGIGSANRVR